MTDLALGFVFRAALPAALLAGFARLAAEVFFVGALPAAFFDEVLVAFVAADFFAADFFAGDFVARFAAVRPGFVLAGCAAAVCGDT